LLHPGAHHSNLFQTQHIYRRLQLTRLRLLLLLCVHAGPGAAALFHAGAPHSPGSHPILHQFQSPSHSFPVIRAAAATADVVRTLFAYAGSGAAALLHAGAPHSPGSQPQRLLPSGGRQQRHTLLLGDSLRQTAPQLASTLQGVCCQEWHCACGWSRAWRCYVLQGLLVSNTRNACGTYQLSVVHIVCVRGLAT
jgi:hypothetical protein